MEPRPFTGLPLVQSSRPHDSPYQTNPLDHHPLREILSRQIDIEAVRACDALRVFVTATNVRTGRPRGIRPRRYLAGGAARLSLSAASPPGGGDRRRPVLGRWLHGQSGHLAPGLSLHDRGRDRPDQSRGARGHSAHIARDRQPDERDRVQLLCHTHCPFDRRKCAPHAG